MIAHLLRIVRCTLAFLLALAACCPPARADEAALTRRATELREAPGETARSVAGLPAQASVLRTDVRRGPWVQVRTANGATGWLHLFDLGPAATPGSDAAAAVSGALRGVSQLLGGTRPTQAGTTAGIRGLGAEDIARAQPNPGAVARMEALRPSDADALAFAQAAGLQPLAVAPLPAPERTAPPPAAAGDPGQPQMP